MVLSNYYASLAWFSNNTSNYTSGGTWYYPSGVYSIQDTKTALWCCLYDYDAILSGYNLNYLALWIGSGNTEVSPSDWKLASDETSNFNNIQRTQSRSVIDVDGVPKIQITCTFSGVNNTENSITIKEIGMTKSYTRASSTAPNYSNKENMALFIRELLNTPVTVAPGQTFTCSLTWVIG